MRAIASAANARSAAKKNVSSAFAGTSAPASARDPAPAPALPPRATLYLAFRTAAPSTSVMATRAAPTAAAVMPGTPKPAPISSASRPVTSSLLRESHLASATPLCQTMFGMDFFSPPR